MELVVIRHGLPETIQRGDGQAADPSLNADGREQAQRVARWLQDERFDAIYSSPLARALQTAAPLAGCLSLPVRTHDGVAEYDRDSEQYVPMEELRERDYELWKRIMKESLFAADPPAFRAVVVAAMEEIIGAHRGGRVAVFCHGGVINAWASHVLESEKVFFFSPYYTSVNRFMAASSGERSVITLNETAHLRPA